MRQALSPARTVVIKGLFRRACLTRHRHDEHHSFPLPMPILWPCLIMHARRTLIKHDEYTREE